MKKVLSLVLAISIVALTCSFGFARGRMPEKRIVMMNGRSNTTSIQKGIQAISPSSSTQSAVQLNAQIEAIKKIIANNNTISQQIQKKKANITKLINKIRRNKLTLNNAQFTSVNNLITSINNEAKLINEVKGFDNRGFMMSNRGLKQYTADQLTVIQTTLSQNTAHLNNISLNYDSIVSILTGIAGTTPAAINLPITTQPAISN